jgi:hypothetical protein
LPIQTVPRLLYNFIYGRFGPQIRANDISKSKQFLHFERILGFISGMGLGRAEKSDGTILE